MLDLTNHRDRNGFVLKFDSARWPGAAHAMVKPTSDVINATCSIDRTSIRAGSGDRAIASVMATDSLKLPLNYTWTATGGTAGAIGAVGALGRERARAGALHVERAHRFRAAQRAGELLGECHGAMIGALFSLFGPQCLCE